MVHRIVVMLGSSKFHEEHVKEAKRLTLAGYIVIPFIFYKEIEGDKEVCEKNEVLLRSICDSKVQMADIVFVVNPDGYIGPRTKESIALAEKLGKEIWYMEEKSQINKNKRSNGGFDCYCDWRPRR